MYQTTLNKSFSFSGVGLHSGQTMTVNVLPAEEGSGILFRRSDVVNCPFVRITPFNVVSTQLATTINCGDFPISTIEHLMAAMYGLGVDNAMIEVAGAEVPILDGSAAPIVDLIVKSGVTTLSAKREYLKITKPVGIEYDGKTVEAVAGDGFNVTFHIDYPHISIQKQTVTLSMTPQEFLNTVGISRTFGFKKDVEALWKIGLAKGGSMDNAIVLDDEGIMNPEGLRHTREFVCHKILDLLGDISLMGYRVIGHITADKSGHHVNNVFARKLIESVSSYHLVELDNQTDGYGSI